MPENLASDGQTARLGAEHEVLLTQGQYLPAHKAPVPAQPNSVSIAIMIYSLAGPR